MQDQCAVRVNHALGESSSAGSETHSRTIVFVDLGILKVVAGVREEFLIVHEAGWNVTAAVRHDDHAFEISALAELFVDREKHVINDEETRARVPFDRGDFLRMKA